MGCNRTSRERAVGARDIREIRQQWREAADKLRERFATVAALMGSAEDDVPAFTSFPKEHWPQLASTNSLER
jgi:transposase-like protein